jgi:hypothetical protein
VQAIVDAVAAYTRAGFTDVAVVQIGDETQDEFMTFAERELLPALHGA